MHRGISSTIQGNSIQQLAREMFKVKYALASGVFKRMCVITKILHNCAQDLIFVYENQC